MTKQTEPTIKELSERMGNPLERGILNDYYISYAGKGLRDRWGNQTKRQKVQI